ncbi:MAG: hypothetical protein ABI175_13570 [Polyangiales bacterium]
MSPDRILFRADASHAIGFGHVTRVCALIEEAAAAGFAPVAMFGGDLAAIESWAAGRQLPLDLRTWTAEEAARAAAEPGVRALVIDGPAITRELLPVLDDRTRAVMVDDTGSDASVATVVNHNVHAADLPYPGARQRLLGRKFLMLRRDIRRYLRGSSRPDPVQGERLRVVVTFGGSDPVNATARTVAMFPPDRPLELVVIAGPGFRDTAALDAAIATARAAGHVVHLRQSPPDPGALFVVAHAAICSAGGTLGELAYLGCPALAYAIVPDQVIPARRQVLEGLIAGGRTWSEVDDDMLRTDLLRFVQDDEGRRVQRQRALASVDADGPHRIIAAAIE